MAASAPGHVELHATFPISLPGAWPVLPDRNAPRGVRQDRTGAINRGIRTNGPDSWQRMVAGQIFRNRRCDQGIGILGYSRSELG